MAQSTTSSRNTPTSTAQAKLGASTVECIPIFATVSNDGECNNKFVTHDEETTDVTQPVPPSPRMGSDPSATLELESSTVLLSQEPADEDT